MDEVIAKYVCGKVVEDLRCGRPLPPNLGVLLDVYPLVDFLRAAVEEPDVPVLLAAAMGEWSHAASLAVSLLCPYATRPDVRDAFRTLWQHNDSFPCRYELTFRLLDDPHLTLEWHREILRFTEEHRREFLEASIAWAGGEHQVLNLVAAQLADPSFPREKTWVYLLIVTASPERASVIELLRAHAAKNDFTATVAAELLESLDYGGEHAMVH